MTTIVYRDKTIAVDGRSSWGDMICNDQHMKMHIRGRHAFFASGVPSDIDEYIDLYLARAINSPEYLGTLSMLVVDSDLNLYQVGVAKKPIRSMWREKLPLDIYLAIGSGAMYAMGAMAMGADAKQSVNCAAAHDVYTGGVIRSWSFEALHELLNGDKDGKLASK